MKSLIGTILILTFLNSCFILDSQESPAKISEKFYQHHADGESFPPDLFLNDDVREEVESLIADRQAMIGDYRSHKKVGWNRNVSFLLQGRRETAVYKFEVTGDKGRVLETLTISRGKVFEPFLITSYKIEVLSEWKESPPPGLNSA